MINNIIRIVTFLIIGSNLYAEPLYLQDDKQKHFIGSIAIAGVGTSLAKHYGSSPLEAWFIGFGTSILIGIAKEKFDGNGHGTEDINDVYADAIGSAIGASMQWRF